MGFNSVFKGLKLWACW